MNLWGKQEDEGTWGQTPRKNCGQVHFHKTVTSMFHSNVDSRIDNKINLLKGTPDGRGPLVLTGSIFSTRFICSLFCIKCVTGDAFYRKL